MKQEIKDQLQILYKTLAKKHKDDAIFFIGQERKAKWKDNVISSGSVKLDLALGVGGYPRGKITEIFGWESSGKTSLALHAIAEAQNSLDRACGFIDLEHALDINYAEDIGVKIDELVFSQPDSAEDALDLCDAWVKSNAFDLIVVDSVSALTPRAEIEDHMGKSHMGKHALLMSQAMRKLTSAIGQTNTAIIFINQIRHKIGVMFGSPETTSGGNSLKYYAAIRLDIRRINLDKEGGRNDVKATVVKNKVAPPFKKAEFGFVWGQGIDHLGEIVDLAAAQGLIEKGGAGWFTLPSGQKVQGANNLSQLLLANLELKQSITEQVLENLHAAHRE